MTDEPAHILVVDDDRRLRELLRKYLSDSGFRVTTAESAEDARAKLGSLAFDLIVLDVMMPGESGLALTAALRPKSTIPILMLTAMGEAGDRIKGLESGADDYLPKPFEPRELVLRLNAVLKRTIRKAPEPRKIRIGEWIFDPETEDLQRSDERRRLTSVEATLLRVLGAAHGEVLSREDLARRCGIDSGERTIDVQVTRLRRKIEEDTKNPRFLQTIRGKGYVLRAEEI